MLSLNVSVSAADTTERGCESMEVVNFTFTNEVEEDDVWILPNTKENRETSFGEKQQFRKRKKVLPILCLLIETLMMNTFSV